MDSHRLDFAGIEGHNNAPLPVWRRNGSLSSCENCRLAKARCDHNAPCGRCLQRGKLCFFHPAPMSKSAAEGANKRQKRGNSTRDKVSNGPETSGQAQTPLVLHQCGYTPYPKESARAPEGYMGSTGHTAIIEENQDVKSILILDESTNEHVSTTSKSQDDEHRAQLGASILAWLPSQRLCERLMNVDMSDLNFVVPFRPPRVHHYMKRFWDLNGSLLSEPRRNEDLKAVSSLLNTNTKKLLPIPANNSEFIESFCGSNSRWELLGEFFLIIGWVVFVMLDDSKLVNDFVPKDMDKQGYAFSMLECADATLRLCDELAVPSNILVATLLNRCVQFQTNISGGSGYELWKRIGSLVAAVTGLGLHVRPTTAETQSALYHEQRNRALWATFALDKDIATFMGRPPLLPRHYISLDLPVDVNDEVLWEESSLEVLRQRNDVEGWNKQGEVHLTTQLRAMLLLRYLRDEILELSLRHQKPEAIDAQVESLQTRMEEYFQRFPPFFQQHIDKNTSIGKVPWEMMSIAQVQLTHYHNIFLCERIRPRDRDGDRFLDASKNMLNIVNTFWSERERYLPLRDICNIFIVYYGIPAASALAIHLWRQLSADSRRLPLPDRPRIVQSLYLFIAALDWVDQAFGTFALRQKIKRLLNDILDRQLSTDTNATPSYLVSGSIWNDDNFSFAGMPNFDIEFDNLDNFFYAGPA